VPVCFDNTSPLFNTTERKRVRAENCFLRPWSIEYLSSCFVVKDSTGQKLACVYFQDEPGRRSAAKLLTRGEARRIGANFAGRKPLVQRAMPRSTAGGLTSALGHKQTSHCVGIMSALPPKADIGERDPHVCFVPIADIAYLITSSAATRRT
jgi:hypothetical protein